MGFYVSDSQGRYIIGTVPTCRTQCQECGGTGQVETIDFVPYGDGYTELTQAWDCDRCNGKGTVLEPDI